MGNAPPGTGASALDSIATSLRAALGLVRELAGDELLRRLLRVFHTMPAADRPVIIEVLEREVLGRVLNRATEKAIGQSTHPNPHARLYVRAHDTGFDRQLWDRDEMTIADIRGLRIATVIRAVPGVYAMWKEAMREAMDHVDEQTWTVAEELLHDVLACIADARAARATAPAGEACPPDVRSGSS